MKVNNKYYLPIEVDATTKTKRNLFKEEMQKRQDKKLYFKCRQLGYIANLYQKGGALQKKKQVNTIGQGIGCNLLKQICATK